MAKSFSRFLLTFNWLQSLGILHARSRKRLETVRAATLTTLLFTIALGGCAFGFNKNGFYCTAGPVTEYTNPCFSQSARSPTTSDPSQELAIAKADAISQLHEAEVGSIYAMEKLAKYLDEGYGVEKDTVKANLWRAKAKEAIAQLKLQLPNNGNIDEKLLNQIADNMVPIPGKNFALGKFDVTQGEWRAVMGNNPSEFTYCGDNCPVESVSWNDVQEFLKKLNAKSNKQYRLPKEEEWEYACYGGAKHGFFSSPDYCGGDDPNAVAWYYTNSDGTTHPVGQKQANGYGLYDMSGNVEQWMENKFNQNGRELRAQRGGYFHSDLIGLRATERGANEPFNGGPATGFRLARTLP